MGTTTVIQQFELPYPPSVNHYWRRVGARIIISAMGRRYREKVCHEIAKCKVATMTGPLQLNVFAFPPDKKTRDLDNLFKGLLDAMTHAKIYQDDSQVRRLTIEWADVVPGGKVEVSIQEMR